jgi:hypothetical protein
MSMDDSIDFTVGLMRHIAKELQALTPEQRLAIADGSAKLKLVVEAPPPKKETAVATSVKAVELQAKLEECKSRDEARAILGELKMSKKELQRVSRELDLPVPRDDDIERLVDRIVESVVGFRLRSMAIQGKSDDAVPKDDAPMN